MTTYKPVWIVCESRRRCLHDLRPKVTVSTASGVLIEIGLAIRKYSRLNPCGTINDFILFPSLTIRNKYGTHCMYQYAPGTRDSQPSTNTTPTGLTPLLSNPKKSPVIVFEARIDKYLPAYSLFLAFAEPVVVMYMVRTGVDI